MWFEFVGVPASLLKATVLSRCPPTCLWSAPQGKPKHVAHALQLLAAAVERYTALTGGAFCNQQARMAAGAGLGRHGVWPLRDHSATLLCLAPTAGHSSLHQTLHRLTGSR